MVCRKKKFLVEEETFFIGRKAAGCNDGSKVGVIVPNAHRQRRHCRRPHMPDEIQSMMEGSKGLSTLGAPPLLITKLQR